MSPPPLAEYLEFITETAYHAGRLTLGHFQTGLQAEYKVDDTPVTLADRKSEELIRSRIARRYPGHTVIGEEYGEDQRSENSHRWFIDPMDGTKAFIRGVPLYGVLIGLEIDGQVEVGAAYFPALDEMICAASGLGCWWNGRRARVSPAAKLEHAFLTTTNLQPYEKSGKLDALLRLSRRCYHSAGWSDAYGYLLVATGRAEIAIDPIMSVWDCAPFPPILREAGGYFGDWQGNATIYSADALATSKNLLAQVVEVLKWLKNHGSSSPA